MKAHKQFNHDYAKSVKRDEFIKQHDHLKEQFDLGKVHDEINGKKPEKESK